MFCFTLFILLQILSTITPPASAQTTTRNCGNINAEADAASVVAFSCEAGYTLKTTPENVVCSNSCTRQLCCDKNACANYNVPNSVTYAAVDSITGMTGDVINIVCNVGHVSLYEPGKNTRNTATTCGGVGCVFSSVACVPLCTINLAVANSDQSNMVAGVGISKTVTCNEGYKVGGTGGTSTTELTCQSDLSFHFFSGLCSPVACTAGLTVANSNFKTTEMSAVTAGVVTVTCDTNYHTSVSTNAVCYKIVTGSEESNEGNVTVLLDRGAGFQNEVNSSSYASGALVFDECLPVGVKLAVQNPTTSAWVGSITANGQPMTCTDCDTIGTTNKIVVDGNADAAEEAVTDCLGGKVCALSYSGPGTALEALHSSIDIDELQTRLTWHHQNVKTVQIDSITLTLTNGETRVCTPPEVQPASDGTGSRFVVHCENGHMVTFRDGGATDSEATTSNCLAKAVAAYGTIVTETRNYLVGGHWSTLPGGCSVLNNGDWAAHWNYYNHYAQNKFMSTGEALKVKDFTREVYTGSNTWAQKSGFMYHRGGLWWSDLVPETPFDVCTKSFPVKWFPSEKNIECSECVGVHAEWCSRNVWDTFCFATCRSACQRECWDGQTIQLVDIKAEITDWVATVRESTSQDATCGTDGTLTAVTCTHDDACYENIYVANSDYSSGTAKLIGMPGDSILVTCNAGFSTSKSPATVVVAWSSGTLVPESTIVVDPGDTVTFQWSGDLKVYKFINQAAYDACDFTTASQLGGLKDTTVSDVIGESTAWYGSPTDELCSEYGHKMQVDIAPQTQYESFRTQMNATCGQDGNKWTIPGECMESWCVDEYGREDDHIPNSNYKVGASALRGKEGTTQTVTCDSGYYACTAANLADCTTPTSSGTRSGTATCSNTGRFLGVKCVGLPCDEIFQGYHQSWTSSSAVWISNNIVNRHIPGTTHRAGNQTLSGTTGDKVYVECVTMGSIKKGDNFGRKCDDQNHAFRQNMGASRTPEICAEKCLKTTGTISSGIKKTGTHISWRASDKSCYCTYDCTFKWTVTLSTPLTATESIGATVTQASQSGVGTLAVALTGGEVSEIIITSAVGQVFDTAADLVINGGTTSVSDLSSATLVTQSEDGWQIYGLGTAGLASDASWNVLPSSMASTRRRAGHATSGMNVTCLPSGNWETFTCVDNERCDSVGGKGMNFGSYGSESTQADCFESARSQYGTKVTPYTTSQNVYVGSWNYLPWGCSIGPSSPWTVHWNTYETPTANTYAYLPVRATNCEKGYRLKSDLNIECGPDGCDSSECCEPNACTKHRNVANSDYAVGTADMAATTHESVVVTCHQGYAMVDGSTSGTSVCGRTGAFLGVSDCLPAQCTSNLIVPNSDYSSGCCSERLDCCGNRDSCCDSGQAKLLGETGDSVVVTCDTGYHFQTLGVQTGSTTCAASGAFESIACSPNPCSSSNVPNSDKASTSIEGNTGSKVTVTCDTDFHVKDTALVSTAATCLADGTFSAVVCVANVKCNNIDGSGVDFSTCSSGFHLKDVLNIFCGAAGCTSSYCCDPNPVCSDTVGDGTNVAFSSCSAGFTLSSDMSNTCKTDTCNNDDCCEPQSCTATNVMNSLLHSTAGSVTGKVRDSVVVQCANGYHVAGSTMYGPPSSYSTSGAVVCGANRNFDVFSCVANQRCNNIDSSGDLSSAMSWGGEAAMTLAIVWGVPLAVEFRHRSQHSAPSTEVKNGDTITFSFDASTQHVMKFPDQTAFDNCDFSSATQLGSGSSPATATMGSETLWFGCSVGDHCVSGQKLKVTLKTKQECPTGYSIKGDLDIACKLPICHRDDCCTANSCTTAGAPRGYAHSNYHGEGHIIWRITMKNSFWRSEDNGVNNNEINAAIGTAVTQGSSTAALVTPLFSLHRPPLSKRTLYVNDPYWKWDLSGPFSNCQGDCNNDDQCIGISRCFQRSAHEQVPGCSVGGAGDVYNYDYCYVPTDVSGISDQKNIVALFKSASDQTFNIESDLVIGSRTFSGIGAMSALINHGTGICTSSSPCSTCHGDCNSDEECAGSLKCFQRENFEQVFNCDSGGDGDVQGSDYCAPLDRDLVNMTMETKETKYLTGVTGDELTVTCPQNYNMDGPQQQGIMVCGSNGEWQPKAGTTVTDCRLSPCFPVSIPNSNHDATNKLIANVGTRFAVQCDFGYDDNSPRYGTDTDGNIAVTTCQPWRQFESVTCVPKLCDDSAFGPEFSNYATTTMSGPGIVTGSYRSVTCNQGYLFGGNGGPRTLGAKCQPNGKMTLPIFSATIPPEERPEAEEIQYMNVPLGVRGCNATNCTPATVADSNFDEANPMIGTTLQSQIGTCKAGYKSTGGVAKETGSFDCDSTKCNSIGGDCCAPNSINEAATCIDGLIPFRTGVGCYGYAEGSYKCCATYAAYQMIHRQFESTCQASGVFMPVTCSKLSCAISNIQYSDYPACGGDPCIPDHQNIVGKFDDEIVVTCNAGYHTSTTGERSGTVTCQADGTFTSFICVPTPCTGILQIPNSDQASVNMVGVTGTIVAVECNDGYHASDVAVSQADCLATAVTRYGLTVTDGADGTLTSNEYNDRPMGCVVPKGWIVPGDFVFSPYFVYYNTAVAPKNPPFYHLSLENDWDVVKSLDGSKSFQAICHTDGNFILKTDNTQLELEEFPPIFDMYAHGEGVSINSMPREKLKFVAIDSGAVTLEAWIRPRQASSHPSYWQYVFGTSGTNTHGFFGIYLEPNGRRVLCNTYFSSGGRPQVISPVDTLTFGQWYHVACTRDDQNVVRLHVNGISMSKDSVTGAYQLVAAYSINGGDAHIGKNPVHGGDFFRGTMGSVRMFTTNIYGSASFSPPSMTAMKTCGDDRTCFAMGNSGSKPAVCVKNTCLKNRNVLNSIYAPGKKNMIAGTGETVDVTCDQGYSTKSTTSVATCQVNGEFTSVLCSKVSCTLGLNVANSDFKTQRLGFPLSPQTGDTVSVTCDAGFYAGKIGVRIGTATCGTNGMFSGVTCQPDPTCQMGEHLKSWSDSPFVAVYKNIFSPSTLNTETGSFVVGGSNSFMLPEDGNDHIGVVYETTNSDRVSVGPHTEESRHLDLRCMLEGQCGGLQGESTYTIYRGGQKFAQVDLSCPPVSSTKVVEKLFDHEKYTDFDMDYYEGSCTSGYVEFLFAQPILIDEIRLRPSVGTNQFTRFKLETVDLDTNTNRYVDQSGGTYQQSGYNNPYVDTSDPLMWPRGPGIQRHPSRVNVNEYTKATRTWSTKEVADRQWPVTTDRIRLTLLAGSGSTITFEDFQIFTSSKDWSPELGTPRLMHLPVAVTSDLIESETVGDASSFLLADGSDFPVTNWGNVQKLTLPTDGTTDSWLIVSNYYVENSNDDDATYANERIKLRMTCTAGCSNKFDGGGAQNEIDPELNRHPYDGYIRTLYVVVNSPLSFSLSLFLSFSLSLSLSTVVVVTCV